MSTFAAINVARKLSPRRNHNRGMSTILPSSWKPVPVAIENVKKGDYYYISHPKRAWVAVVVLDHPVNKKCRVQILYDDTVVELDLRDCPLTPMYYKGKGNEVNNLALCGEPAGRDDVLNEPAVLSILETRSKGEPADCYMYIGHVLVCMNPLREFIDPQFVHVANSHLDRIQMNQPHPYDLAEEEYIKLKTPRKSTSRKKGFKCQTVIINGMSGSGISTVSSKILEYLCWRGTDGKSVNKKITSNTSTISIGGRSTARLSDVTDDVSFYSSRIGSSGRAMMKNRLWKCFSDINLIFNTFLSVATSTNQNSSRYGRLIQLTFGKSTGGGHVRGSDANHCIHGATVEAFFPDITSLTSPRSNRRNFNIFYSLLLGANSELRRTIAALPISRFNYLFDVGDPTVEKVTDVSNYKNIVEALSSIGVSSLHRQALFKLLSACLHLGNVNFEMNNQNQRTTASKSTKDVSSPLMSPADKNALLRGQTATRVLENEKEKTMGNSKKSFIPFNLSIGKKSSSSNVKQEVLKQDFVKVSQDGPLAVSALLLGIHSDDLQKVLLQGSQCTIESAERTRDHVAKAIYLKAITWLLDQSNERLKQIIVAENPPIQLYSSTPQQINIIEYPGFMRSSDSLGGLYELLCNIANERLRQAATDVLVTYPQEMMKSEGIKGVKALRTAENMGHDSKEVLRILEGNPNGVVTLLENWNKRDEIMTGDPASAFISYMLKANKDERVYLLPSSQQDPLAFTILHYIGKVEYTTEGMVQANRDIIWRGTVEKSVMDLLSQSPCSFILNRSQSEKSPILQGGEFLDNSAGASASCRMCITQLLENVTTDSANFVMCVAPNKDLVFGSFDHKYVADQIRGLNLVAICQTMRMGANTHILYSELDTLYRQRLPSWARKMEELKTSRDITQATLWAHDINQASVKWGEHSLFIRYGEVVLLHYLRLTAVKKEERETVLKLISCWAFRKMCRRALAYQRANEGFLELYDFAKRKRRAIQVLRKARLINMWRTAGSGRYHSARRRQLRRKWKILFCTIMAVRMFSQEIELVAGANSIHKKAEASALEQEKRELEFMKELEDHERESRHPSKTPDETSRPLSVSDLEHQRKILGASLKDLAAGSDLSVIKEEMEKQRNAREFRATAASTALTACLFRWQRVHQFAAFDKWLEVLSTSPHLKGSSSNILDRYLASVPENDSVTESNLEAIYCAECEFDRRVSIYCGQCPSHYCSVCSSFVHNSCRIMRQHIPEPMEPIDDNDSEEKDNFCRRTGASKICSIRTCDRVATHGVSIRFCIEHYKEFRQALAPPPLQQQKSDEAEDLYNQISLLKRQLAKSGQVALEFVSLETARERMQEAVKKLIAGDESAEKDIDKWDQCIRLHPDYEKEQKEQAEKWEAENKEKNLACLRTMRGLVPPDILQSGVNKMVLEGLPILVAQRIWKFKVLQWVRWHPDDIKKVHIADLQTNYTNQGLDVLEMRAVWTVIPEEFDLDNDKKKEQWRLFFCQKLQELTKKEETNSLSSQEKRHKAYKGTDGLQVYDPDAPLQKKALAKSTAFDATEQPTELLKTVQKEQVVIRPKISGNLEAMVEEGKMPKMMFGVLLDTRFLIYESENDFKEDQNNEDSEIGKKEGTIEFLLDSETTVEPVPQPKEARGGKRHSLRINCKTMKKDMVILFHSEALAKDWNKFLIKVAHRDKPKTSKTKLNDGASSAKGPPRPPPPSFLQDIASKGKGGGGGGGDDDSPPGPPSFLDELKKKKAGGPAGANGPPSFLDEIKKKKGNGPAAPPGPPSFLDEIKKKNANGPAAANSPPSFLDEIKKKANGPAGPPSGAPNFLDEIKKKKAAKEAAQSEVAVAPEGGGGASFLDELKNRQARNGGPKPAANTAPNFLEEMRQRQAVKEARETQDSAAPSITEDSASIFEELKRKNAQRTAQNGSTESTASHPRKPNPFGDNPAGATFLEAIRQRAIEKEKRESGAGS